MDSESFLKKEQFGELQFKSSVLHSYISEGEVVIIVRKAKINTLQNELKLLKSTIAELRDELRETTKALEKFEKQNAINKSHNKEELQVCVEKNDDEETECINGSSTNEEMLTVQKIEVQNEDQNEFLHMEFFQEENVSSNEISQSSKLAEDNTTFKTLASSSVTESESENKDVTEQYFCDTCGKKLATKNTMQAHLLTHIQVAAFKCSKCSKGFSNGRGLRLHFLALHCGKKSYQCDICKKLFLDFQCLQKHLKRHVSKHRYHCLECDKSFFIPSALNRHKRVHTGERPFKCLVCCKKFTRKSYMTHHYRTHTGEKPYECQICHKTFLSNEYLKLHCRTWHKSLRINQDRCLTF